jgi:hypothetical protein
MEPRYFKHFKFYIEFHARNDEIGSKQ